MYSTYLYRFGIPYEEFEGRTALRWACDIGNVKRVKKLVRERVDHLNVEDNNGWTPLHIAASNGHSAIVRILIDAGADMDIADVSGLLADDVAERNCAAILAHERLKRRQAAVRIAWTASIAAHKA